MKLVPVREIHEIEFSSVCNLACVYCPHPELGRPKAHMTEETFGKVLSHLRHLCEARTQGEVSLTGIGEAILHPRFAEYAARVRHVIGNARQMVLATNGVAVTDRIADACAQLRIGVYVSMHRPEVGAPARERLIKAGVMVGENHAFVDSSIDWAGQVAWHVSAPRSVCQYLQRGWAVIRQDGAVVACCQDAHDKFPIGHVDDAPGSLHNRVTGLCASCHLVIPSALRDIAA